MRSWLYRIATNVCNDMQRSAQRRARPMDFGPAFAPDEANLGPVRPEAVWVSPIADRQVMIDSTDPAEIAVARESIRLAFVTALQHLPAHYPWALQVLEISAGRVSGIHSFLDAERLFAAFGLPAHLAE